MDDPAVHAVEHVDANATHPEQHLAEDEGLFEIIEGVHLSTSLCHFEKVIKRFNK